ncbi:MAG TPA: protein-glutamate O-methyltransferase CheR [Cytophagaceae bacterium]
MQEIGITDLKKLTNVIYLKYGLDFRDYAISSFKRRIQRLIDLKNIPNVELLISKIEANSFTKDEFLHEITVNVTEMFRDPSFWRVLKTTISDISKNQEKIRIWHAGCSSGEEVYSMVIMLKELNLLDRCQIVASDIDNVILEKAKLGQVSNRNMELNCKNYLRYNEDKGDLNNYFTVSNNIAQLDTSLLKNVNFRIVDLVTATPFSKFDIILCRNVMIYFNQNLQAKVLKLLHESLFNFSYLCIGTKENIIWCDIVNKFTIVNNEERIYKKIKE